MGKRAKQKRSVEGGGEGLKGRRGIYGEITSTDGCFLFVLVTMPCDMWGRRTGRWSFGIPYKKAMQYPNKGFRISISFFFGRNGQNILYQLKK